MSEQAWNILMTQGPVCVLLGVAVYWLAKRGDRIERDGKNAAATAQAACEARESDLRSRIRQLEDAQRDEYREERAALLRIVEENARALSTNARAFERVSEAETDRHERTR